MQKNTGTAGGAELQQVTLAKELIKNGFDVSFIVDDYGQRSLEIVNEIKIFKLPACNNSGIKSYPHKLYLYWKILTRADADVYYIRGASFFAGYMAFFCIIKNKKFIYSIAHQTDVDGTHIQDSYLKNLPPFGGYLNKQLYKFGVKNANCIVAQNQEQQRLLYKNFNRYGILIKSMCDLPIEKTVRNTEQIVLWVSSMQRWKQPELFLELAKSIPTVRFQMIGGPADDKEFYKLIEIRAKKISNLDFLGFVPYHEINQYFDRASVFVNTSTAEGFPNTFLQSWARYKPVVSLNVDPDDVICKYKLGFHSRTFDQMISDIKNLVKNENLRDEMGVNGRHYVEKEHDIKKIVGGYLKVFKRLRCA